MRNLPISSVLWVLFLIGITSCEKSKLDAYIPRVEIIEIVVNDNNVRIEAKVNNPEKHEISGYGLRWRAPGNFIQEIYFTEDFSSGTFSYNIEYGLMKDEQYKIQAFLNRPEQRIMSREKPFTAKGSNAPTIENISRFSGVEGDTIHIEGKGFPMILFQGFPTFFNHTVVELGAHLKAPIFYISEKKISAIVPANYTGNLSLDMILKTHGHSIALGKFEYTDLSGK